MDDVLDCFEFWGEHVFDEFSLLIKNTIYNIKNFFIYLTRTFFFLFLSFSFFNFSVLEVKNT